VQVNLLHKVSVVSASTPVVKEGASTLGSPTAIEGEDFKVNGLTQPHKWPVGFGLSGEDGDSPYPLGVLPPELALDWELDSDEDMDLSLAILEAIEGDFHRGVKTVRPKTNCRREVLNLVSIINYSDSSVSSWLRKGKTHMV